MQISQRELFVFVEGTSIDGYVHGKNCDIALDGLGIDYEVVPATRLPGSGSGKTRLVAHFQNLESNGALASDFKGKRTISVFFMDKDVDDHKNRLISSRHVIYTDYYDVENHVFSEGDVAKAVAVACSLSPRWSSGEFGEVGKWQEQAASLWQGWVRLCFSANTLSIPGEFNYGRPSPLNDPHHAPSNDAATDVAERKSHDAARRSMEGSCVEWGATRSKVDALYAAGQWDQVFKGKWYAEILASHVIAAAPNPIDRRALSSVLVRQVAATMTFTSPWCISVQARVRNLAVYLKAA